MHTPSPVRVHFPPRHPPLSEFNLGRLHAPVPPHTQRWAPKAGPSPASPLAHTQVPGRRQAPGVWWKQAVFHHRLSRHVVTNNMPSSEAA